MGAAAAAFRTPHVVVVASNNPAKIIAARRAVELCWPNRSELQVFGECLRVCARSTPVSTVEPRQSLLLNAGGVAHQR